MPRISKPRYETYKEASEAAIALGIETSTKYKTEYKQDPRLSANPAVSVSYTHLTLPTSDLV